jgi:crotonobetainyl-CoA:carnitine CoA-transferase CaiB-like acyl-CoA transferase
MSHAGSAGVHHGLRVVDFGHYLAGPMVAVYLADFGADVIYIDPPGGPRCDNPANAALQRNKRTVHLALKTPRGQRDDKAVDQHSRRRD